MVFFEINLNSSYAELIKLVCQFGKLKKKKLKCRKADKKGRLKTVTQTIAMYS